MFSSADNDILYQRQQASPDEFVSRPFRDIALCIPSVHHFRRKMHAHIREQKICSFFSASKKNFHRHVIGFGDIPFISIVCNRAKSSKRFYKHKDTTAKHQDEGLANSTHRIYSCHFAGSTHFYFTKAGGRKMGSRGGC